MAEYTWRKAGSPFVWTLDGCVSFRTNGQGLPHSRNFAIIARTNWAQAFWFLSFFSWKMEGMGEQGHFFFFLIYLFMAVLGLRFYARAFSSCSKRGPLFITVRGPLTVAASLCCGAQAQQLWLTGLVAPWHVGSSQTRARTRVPCIGRQILNHCATREAPTRPFLTSDNIV